MIALDFRDSRPIYEQIVEKISDLAARGILEANSQLPSVRQMALELSINPNTIQRAYSELEKKEIIYSLKGKGNFISSDISRIKSQRQEKILKDLRNISLDAYALGVCSELLKEKIDEYYGTFNKGETL